MRRINETITNFKAVLKIEALKIRTQNAQIKLNTFNPYENTDSSVKITG